MGREGGDDRTGASLGVIDLLPERHGTQAAKLRLVEFGPRQRRRIIEFMGLDELPAEQFLVGLGPNLDLHQPTPSPTAGVRRRRRGVVGGVPGGTATGSRRHDRSGGVPEAAGAINGGMCRKLPTRSTLACAGSRRRDQRWRVPNALGASRGTVCRTVRPWPPVRSERPAQSSRCTRSIRSWRSCASIDSVAIGRASSRRRPIGSPVSSQ